MRRSRRACAKPDAPGDRGGLAPHRGRLAGRAHHGRAARAPAPAAAGGRRAWPLSALCIRTFRGWRGRICSTCTARCWSMDDELCSVGSANFNNRSMGFDTECNIAIEARGDERIRRRIAGLRDAAARRAPGSAPGGSLRQRRRRKPRPRRSKRCGGPDGRWSRSSRGERRPRPPASRQRAGRSGAPGRSGSAGPGVRAAGPRPVDGRAASRASRASCSPSPRSARRGAGRRSATRSRLRQ